MLNEGSVACYWSFNFKVEELCGIMIQKSICEIGIEVFNFYILFHDLVRSMFIKSVG
jgi:hypothetical protein